MAPVVDTLRLSAEEAGRLLEAGEVSPAELRGAYADGHRRARRRAPLLPAHDGERGRRRRADRAQGRHLDEGRRDDRGLEDPRRLRPRLRRDRRGAREGGRAPAPREDEHGRVRDGLLDRELGLRPVPQPVGSFARAWWLGRGLRGRGHGRHDALGARLRHRRLDQAAVGAVRQRGAAADVRERLALRRRGVRVEPRPDRARGEDGARRRAPVLDHRGARPARLDLDRAARAGPASRGRLARGRPRRRADGAERGGGDRVWGTPGGRGGNTARGEPRRRGGGVLAAALRALRPALLLPHRPGRGLVEPRPLRRRPLRAAHRGRQLPGDGRPDARRGLRRGAEAPDHARHVRALGRLLRRVLRAGAARADAHHPGASRGARALRRPRLAHVADGRVPDRGARRGSARDVRERPADDPLVPRRASPGSRSHVGCRTGFRSGSSSSARSSARTSCSASGTRSRGALGFDTVPERWR